MPINTKTLPQTFTPTTSVTIYDLIKILPLHCKYPLDVWVAGDLARYGKTNNTIIFLLNISNEPSTDIKIYFEEMIKPLKLQATATENWKDNRTTAIKLYNQGKLIIDKKTFAYTEVPSPVQEEIYITWQEVLSKLPTTIPYLFTIYFTGGVVKNGWSFNDVDMIIFDPSLSEETLKEIKNYFTDILKWHCDIGRAVMSAREPVYLYKLYENGQICKPSS